MTVRPLLHVAYAVPPRSLKASTWHDGFTAALELLQRDFEVRRLNVHPDHPGRQAALEALPDCDVLLAKSNWNWIVDRLVRRHCRRSRAPAALMISGVADPPRRRRMRFYGLLFYETPWYEPRLAHHPRRVHAFGVDTRVMTPTDGAEPDVDWLSVGALKAYKRHGELAAKRGRRVVVGDHTGADPAVVDELESAGVELLDFVTYRELAGWYRRARNVLVGATEAGGGERSVLEARACGARVHVAPDNRKLLGLLDTPLWDHEYYADRLGAGLRALVPSGRRSSR
jgi:hypothetical protein